MSGTPAAFEAGFAWPRGDRPGTVDFRYEPSPSVARAISEALALSFPAANAVGGRYQALCPAVGPVGRYRLSTQEGSWFIRVSPHLGRPELEKAVTDHLLKRGVAVNPLLIAGAELRWGGKTFRIDVRPMIEGRHFNGSPDDLYHVATILSTCHRALLDFPLVHQIRLAAADRHERLAKIRDLITAAVKHDRFELFVERAHWASEHRHWLAEMVEQFDPYLNERPDAQCVHGEVHPGNVLFRVSDGAAVLLDFEESIHLFMPRSWDLAFLVQRFCLSDHPSPSIALERLAAIAEGYGRALPPLASMMRQAAWFTMATIVDLRISQGVVTRIAEYNKFLKLERQARMFEGVL